jgi:hypothetical protein
LARQNPGRVEQHRDGRIDHASDRIHRDPYRLTGHSLELE